MKIALFNLLNIPVPSSLINLGLKKLPTFTGSLILESDAKTIGKKKNCKQVSAKKVSNNFIKCFVKNIIPIFGSK
jgi:hypothetical protein